MCHLHLSFIANLTPPPPFPNPQHTIQELIRIDSNWVPEGDGYSLYLRPTAIATHPWLGVGDAQAIKMFVITCPVGPYYPTGFNPVRLYADSVNVRAWPGGTGNCKVGGGF